MPRYADTLLADGERIVLRARQHWLAPLVRGRLAILLVLAGLVLLLLAPNVGEPLRTALGWFVLALLVGGIAWLGYILWDWWAQDYIVTNRRVMKVEGIVNKRAADSSLEKINDAVLVQDLFGRLLNYGDLEILTASEAAIDDFVMLAGAPRFKREMLNQKHELEGELTRPVAPPLRASPQAPGGPTAASRSPDEPAAGAGMPAPSPASRADGSGEVPGRRMSPEEVTRTLAQLADLRDRGAITVEEYEAKKRELLARL